MHDPARSKPCDREEFAGVMLSAVLLALLPVSSLAGGWVRLPHDFSGWFSLETAAPLLWLGGCSGLTLVILGQATVRRLRDAGQSVGAFALLLAILMGTIALLDWGPDTGWLVTLILHGAVVLLSAYLGLRVALLLLQETGTCPLPQLPPALRRWVSAERDPSGSGQRRG